MPIEFYDGTDETADEEFERAATRSYIFLILVGEFDLDWTDGQDLFTIAKDQSLANAKLAA